VRLVIQQKWNQCDKTQIGRTVGAGRGTAMAWISWSTMMKK
jgi:hypothetical protein